MVKIMDDLIIIIGRFHGDIKKIDGGIEVNGHKVKVYAEKDAS